MLLCFALVFMGSSIGRAALLECMRRGFECHVSAAFSEEKVVTGLVLCCVVLSFFLSV